MGSIADKLDYLEKTKSRFMNAMYVLGYEIDDETTLREAVDYLVEEAARKQVEDFDVSSLPQYWQEDTRDALEHVLMLGDDYIHHLVATDSHYTSNNNESVAMIELLQATGLFSKVIHLGDIVNSGSSGETANADETKAYEMFGRFNGDLLFALGNHDNGTMKGRAYQAFLSESDDIVGTDIPSTMSYYWDDSENKIRYYVDAFSTTASYEGNSANSLCTTENVGSLPDGWRFIILAHAHPLHVLSNYSSSDINDLQYINAAGQTVASQTLVNGTKPFIASLLTGHEFIGWITGHLHDDGIDSILGGAVSQATLANDGTINGNQFYPKVANTDESQAITIMSIGKRTREVKFYRLGRVHRLGRSFSFTYTPASQLDGTVVKGIELKASANTFQTEQNAMQIIKVFPSKDANGSQLTYYWYSKNPNRHLSWIVACTFTDENAFVDRWSRTVSTNGANFDVDIYKPTGDKFMLAVEFTDANAVSADVGITSELTEILSVFDSKENVYSSFSGFTWLNNYYWDKITGLKAEEGSAATNGYFRVTPGKTYKISVTNPAFGSQWMYANYYKTPLEYVDRGGSNSASSITFTIPAGVNYITFSAQNLVGYTNDVVFEEVTT